MWNMWSNRMSMQELLQMVPQPVVAVLFLFPVTKESEAAKEAGIPLGVLTWTANKRIPRSSW